MKAQSFFLFLVACVSALNSACSLSPTSRYFQEANGPAIRELGLRRVSPSEVLVIQMDPSVANDKAKFQQWMKSNRDDKNLVFLGNSSYTREGRPSLDEIRLAAARLGAKVAYVYTPYAGKGQKTIAVPIAHTTGQTITHSSHSQGSLSGSGFTNGMYGNTPYSSNTQVGGSYSGSTTSSTYIPGTTTYAARDVSFDAYDVVIGFFVPMENLSGEGRELVKASRSDIKRY